MKRLFIIGQDLNSVRGYYKSACCSVPDGQTAYLDFYNLLSGESGYGGLGIDLEGHPLEKDWDWGTGPANAWKSATEYPGGFAIGLSITENDHPGGLDRIVSGELDDNARQLARFIRLIDRPVYLRDVATVQDGPEEVKSYSRIGFGPAEKMTILATGREQGKNPKTDRHEPMLMVVEYGQGRIFHTTLGHDDYSCEGVGFIVTLTRGVEWAATGKVTQPIPADFPTAENASFRKFSLKK